MRTATFLALLLSLGTTPLAATTIVENDNLTFEENPFMGGEGPFGDANYVATVIQDLRGDFTQVWFDYDGENLRVITHNVDEGSDWYVVQPGDELTLVNIEEDQFTTVLDMADSERPLPGLPVIVGNDEFFLGVRTGPDGAFEPSLRDVFGWIHLRNTPDGLETVANVMSYDSPGIIVGTTIIVPEPGSWILIILALICLGAVRYVRRFHIVASR